MSQPAGARILVVDDDHSILRAVRTILPRHGFQVETAETGRQALERHAFGHPDLILLDLGLPDVDGLAVIQAVRANSSTPIVVLSVRGAEHQKVAAIDLGADDYLTKPFGMDELVARIRLALRHTARPLTWTDAIFRTGDLEVDLERRRVAVGGREVHLTPTEYELLKVFLANPNRVLTTKMLLRAVWGPEYDLEEHYLHVYLATLRKKLEENPHRPRHLVTEPGVGYRLLAEDR
jgi:two-component system, OmpR family, KDP operon response regulator KdpE